MNKSYEELIQIPDYKDRFEYLKLSGSVGQQTFGSKRYLNQLLYRNPIWRSLRNEIIVRDNACDLSHPDFSLGDMPAFIHHINPITLDDILENRSNVFNPSNLITVSFQTHQAIHYGDSNMLMLETTRKPNDTCPWR